MLARFNCGLAVTVCLLAGTAKATNPVATLPYAVSDFVENSSGTMIYGAVPGRNSIVEINPNTLAGTLISVGNNPTSVALTPDGNTLYVANQGSGTISVLNTQTNTFQTPLSVGSPLGVQVVRQ